MTAEPSNASRPAASLWRLGLGLALFALSWLLPVPEGFSAAGWRTAGVAAWMAAWWMLEAVPVWATALLPLVAFPVFGISPVKPTAASYANPVIYLFLGGFILAAAMQAHGLHRRLALALLATFGTKPERVAWGFMLATAFLSAWVSNTATSAMMIPLALSVVQLAGADAPSFARALVLGVAYAASIGGLATLIGTPPNALLAGFLAETYGIDLGFGRWMLLGVPLAAMMLPITWWLLVRVLSPIEAQDLRGGRDLVERERRSLGQWSQGEILTATIFGGTALAWATRPLLANWIPGISDAGIALTASLLLFALPAGGGRRILDGGVRDQIPWDILLLFGGGLALAGAFQSTGLAASLGELLSFLESWPLPLLVLVIAALLIFLTELTSNTASTATFLPVVGAIAVGIGADPLDLTVPAALAAGCAFMLPVATPPNAIAFASGQVTLPEMARAGLRLNLLFLVLVPLFALAALRLLPIVS